jgi:tetratricopeptide (TPR) repeat protein
MPAPIRRVDELGFPIPPKFEDFQTGDSEPRPPRRPILKLLGRWRWLILLLVPAILFGPQAVDFVRGIVANIQLQRAEQDVLQHNFPRAVFHASRAIAWEPDPLRRTQALALRAYLQEKLHHLDEALKDYDEAIAVTRQEKTKPSIAIDLAFLYHSRAWVQHRRGHDREALDDCKSALAVFPARRQFPDSRSTAELLNLKAYICALSGLEVEDGVKAINEALGAVHERNEAMLDTRACLEYRQGKFDAAMKDMETAIQNVEERRGHHLGWDAGPLLAAPDDYELDNESFAVMLYHRGEIHRKLASQAKDASEAESQSKKADADIAHAKEIGFDSKQDEALEPAPRG